MRILETVTNLDGGGVDTLMLGYCSRIIPKHHFDFLVRSDNEGILEAPIKQLGCGVIHLPRIKPFPFKYIKTLKKTIKNGKYDIVHAHGNYKSFFVLYYAKKYGVKVRIIHSHIAFIPESKWEKIKRSIFTPLVKNLATDLFACGRDAARWMWGEKEFNNNNVYIMRNAIDTNKFSFSQDIRNKMRQELGIEQFFVVGNVARLSYQKNQEFLIKTFFKIKQIYSNSVLLLIGRGDTESMLKRLVSELNLNDSVMFLGIRDDVPELLNAMDVFVLPSRFEGLPVSLVEAQANGVPSVVSDSITDEVKMLDNSIYLSLDDSEDVWAQTIINLKDKRLSSSIVNQSGYEISIASKDLCRKYESLYLERK